MTQAPIVSKPGISQSDPQGSTHEPLDAIAVARARQGQTLRRRARHATRAPPRLVSAGATSAL